MPSRPGDKATIIGKVRLPMMHFWMMMYYLSASN